ncbi:hypothetical protein V6N13_107057 [Hibiscus sabdariffa]
MMESKLKAGTTLIVDRYSYSGVAFSSAKGLDFEWCKAPEIGLIAPDLVLYLDIPPEKAAERGGYGDERYEQLEFQKKVARHYKLLEDSSWKIMSIILLFLSTAKIKYLVRVTSSGFRPLSYGYLGQVKIIDASRSLEDVEKQVKETVSEYVMTCQKGKPLSSLWSY